MVYYQEWIRDKVTMYMYTCNDSDNLNCRLFMKIPPLGWLDQWIMYTHMWTLAMLLLLSMEQRYTFLEIVIGGTLTGQTIA